MQELNAKLMARAQSVEQKHNVMVDHVTQMNECLKQKTLENERLQSELSQLKRSMQVRPVFPLHIRLTGSLSRAQGLLSMNTVVIKRQPRALVERSWHGWRLHDIMNACKNLQQGMAWPKLC